MDEERLGATFGKVLREYRTKAGLSQEALADRANLDRTYVSLLERGLRLPTLGTVFRLSGALGVGPGTLVGKCYARLT